MKWEAVGCYTRKIEVSQDWASHTSILVTPLIQALQGQHGEKDLDSSMQKSEGDFSPRSVSIKSSFLPFHSTPEKKKKLEVKGKSCTYQ